MTDNPPPEDSDRAQPLPPVDDARPDPDRPADGVSDQDLREGSPPEESPGEELSEPSSSEIASSEQTGEDEVPDADKAEPSAQPADEVSLFVVPARHRRPPPAESGASREMGWKMMAVAGILLLAAGFVAGAFFPESDSPPEEITAATAPAEPTTTSTSAPSVSAPSTTAAPVAPPSTTAATTPAEMEVPAVEPPDLVTTDEPVADVATRMVPSVVHLEIGSDDLFEQGAGSGVIIDSGGYILTAAHVVSSVVEGDAELTVRLSNGDRLPGQVVGADPDSDIAVVEVERGGLTPAELALDFPPRVGQMVVAVGSPWGLESSVTSGVISAVDRIVDGKLLVQSDAVLYPGNSGGALADRYGRLIGINVSIFTDSTTSEAIEFQGVGFAVPVDVAYRVARALIEGRPVHTAFLGISGRDTGGDAGVEIMEVFPNSGAEQAGLKIGDVVVGVGGLPVAGIADLAARIRHLEPGDLIVLNVLRGEENLSLAATLLPRSEVMEDEEQSTQEPPQE